VELLTVKALSSTRSTTKKKKEFEEDVVENNFQFCEEASKSEHNQSLFRFLPVEIFSWFEDVATVYRISGSGASVFRNLVNQNIFMYQARALMLFVVISQLCTLFEVILKHYPDMFSFTLFAHSSPSSISHVKAI
jgi:hypothetical protein